MFDTDFQNPDPFPSYEGNFTVELVAETATGNCPEKTVTLHMKGESVVATITSGKITQSAGALQLHDHQGSLFYWSYDRIVAIRDQDGNPLWLNDDYRPKPKFKIGQKVKIVRLMGTTTTRDLIDTEGYIKEIDPLVNGELEEVD